jgi:hypothetical protein
MQQIKTESLPADAKSCHPTDAKSGSMVTFYVDQKQVGTVDMYFLRSWTYLIHHIGEKREIHLITGSSDVPSGLNPGDFICKYFNLQKGEPAPNFPMPIKSSKFEDNGVSKEMVQLLISLDFHHAVQMAEFAHQWQIPCLLKFLMLRMAIAIRPLIPAPVNLIKGRVPEPTAQQATK